MPGARDALLRRARRAAMLCGACAASHCRCQRLSLFALRFCHADTRAMSLLSSLLARYDVYVITSLLPVCYARDITRVAAEECYTMRRVMRYGAIIGRDI